MREYSPPHRGGMSSIQRIYGTCGHSGAPARHETAPGCPHDMWQLNDARPARDSSQDSYDVLQLRGVKTIHDGFPDVSTTRGRSWASAYDALQLKVSTYTNKFSGYTQRRDLIVLNPIKPSAFRPLGGFKYSSACISPASAIGLARVSSNQITVSRPSLQI